MCNVSTKYLREPHRCSACGGFTDTGGDCGSNKPKCVIRFLMGCGFTRKEARMMFNKNREQYNDYLKKVVK